MGTDSLKTQLKAVQTAWDTAPVYVRTMGGMYMTPVMALLLAMVERLDALEGGAHGN